MTPSPAQRRLMLVAVLLLVGIGGVLGGFAWGFQAHRARVFPYDWLRAAITGRTAVPTPETPGRWRLRDGRRPWLYEDDEALTWEALQALGYAQGSVLAPEASGVVTRTDRAWPGLNLVTSGHAPEAVLIDLDGQVVHRWEASWEAVFPGQVAAGEPAPRPYWRRARLLPDGGLLTMFVDKGAFRLNRDSGVVWTWPGGAHHDLALDGDSVWVLARRARVRPEHARDPMLDDALVRLDLATGQEQQRFAVWDAFADGPWAARLRAVQARADGDPLHTNTVEVLDGRFVDQNPAFASGNLMISLRNTDLVAIVDPRVQQVVWAWAGPWHQQHEPTLVEPGHLLVFDNMGAWPRSRVLELDPATLGLVWAYDGGDVPLVSETCGTAQRLPGGTTVAVASDTGVAVEVDRQGDAVWTYVNPERAGEQQELIATLFQVERLWGSALGVFEEAAPPVPVLREGREDEDEDEVGDEAGSESAADTDAGAAEDSP